MSSDNPHTCNDGHSRLSLWWFAVPAVLLLVTILVLRSGPGPAVDQDSPGIGKPAPRLDLVRLTDQPVLDRLQKVPDGKVTLLHFWGTWCGPCKMEYPELVSMAKAFQARPGFRFVSVSCEGGRGETFDGLREKTFDYFATEGIDGPVFADPQGITRRSAAERLEQNAMYYPTTIIVGREGKISGVWEGFSPTAVGQMEALINRLLSDAGRQRVEFGKSTAYRVSKTSPVVAPRRPLSDLRRPERLRRPRSDGNLLRPHDRYWYG